MANLRIGVLSSSQRLTEVSKKFRAKMSGYLIGHILPEDFIGILQRALKLHMGPEAKTVTSPEFRYSFYYSGLNQVFNCDEFKPVGTPYEIKRSQPIKHQPINQLLPKKKTLKQKIKALINVLFGPSLTVPKLPINYKQSTNNQENNDEDETRENTAFGVPIDVLEEKET